MSVQIPTFVTLPGIGNAANGGASGDFLGSNPRGLCISADTSVIVAGAPLFGVSDTGRIMIFNRDTTTDNWNFLQSITTPVVSPGIQFGTCVDITYDDNVIAGGANGTLGGRVFMFLRNAYTNSYNFYQALRGSGIVTTGATPRFGEALSFSGDANFLAIGAPGCNFSYVFTSNVGTTYIEQQRITCPVAGTNNFGQSIRFSGDGNYVLVGSPTVAYPGGLTNRGMAFMYKKDTGTANWSLVQNISTPAINGTQFSVSCDINYDGTYAVFGCTNRSSFFFKKNTGTEFWNCLQAVTTSDTLAGSGFMTSISDSGDYIAVGNRRLTTSDRGGVLYFQKQTNTDFWQQLSTLQATAATAVEYAGAGGMISHDGTYMVYSAPGFATNRGTFYVSYRDWTSYMPSTNTVGLIGLASTSRNTVVLPKASSITAPMTWIKDTTPNRTFYNLFTISTSSGDLIDGVRSTISFCNAGLGLHFAQDRVSNWYTLNYYDGK